PTTRTPTPRGRTRKRSPRRCSPASTTSRSTRSCAGTPSGCSRSTSPEPDAPVGPREHRGVDEQLRGRLLVATPDLDDPNFFRSVVLVLEHNREGALGVVLNRPGATAVATPLPAWAALVVEPAVLFVGGPVQPEAAIGIGRRVDGDAADGFAPL